MIRVGEIWRYPVKSLAGEQLASVELTSDGIPGDRIVQVYDERGRMLTARKHPRLLGLRASLGADGEPLVNGRPWTEPDVAEAIRDAVGGSAWLRRDDSLERFDILPLLVATDGAIHYMGMERRRFRPNLFLEGVKGLAERAWEGRQLRIGEAVIGLDSLRGRCVMTTFDPDTLAQDHSVLRRIAEELGGKLALNAYVVKPARVSVGDPIVLL